MTKCPNEDDDVARLGVKEDLAGDAHIERQAVHGRDQQEGGEHGEIESLLHVHAREKDDDPADEVQRDEDIDQLGRQGHDQHHDDADHRRRNAHHCQAVATQLGALRPF